MVKSIVSEIEYILNYYCKLFNYKSILLFPSVTGNSIKPILAIQGDQNLRYNKANQIQWINFYQDILTHDSMAEHATIQGFMDHYRLDMVMPIRSDQRCLGFLGIAARAKKINQVELRIADFIMHYLSQLWKNVELLYDIRRASDQTRTLLEEMTTLMEISRAIESGKDLQSLLEFIMDECLHVVRAEAGSILLMCDDGKAFEFKVALGPKGKNVKSFKLPLGKGIAGWVAQNGEPLLIPDAYADERFDPSFDAKSGFKTKSILCVPLVHQNQILGVVQALNRLDGKEFNTHDQQVFTIFATQAALAIENSRLLFREIEKETMERDLKVASEIQHLIIPKSLPQNYGLELCGTHIPCQQVGGDFYSVFPVNEVEIVFCIADVAGKGVSGALLVSTMHATLRAYLNYSVNLIEIVNSLNQLIMELSTANKFITLFLAKYNKQTSMLEHINAGHNPPLLIRKNQEIIKLQTKGVSIGIIEFSYSSSLVKLEKYDLLVLYTDGVTETLNVKNEVFGEKRLLDILKENHGKKCSYIQEKIFRVLELFRHPRTPSDDLTLMLARK